MNRLRFEWDPAKAAANLQKHGVSMAEARAVFLDPLAATRQDPDHSLGEERYITVGYSDGGRLLAVVNVEVGSTLRIISARPATPAERRHYEES